MGRGCRGRRPCGCQCGVVGCRVRCADASGRSRPAAPLQDLRWRADRRDRRRSARRRRHPGTRADRVGVLHLAHQTPAPPKHRSTLPTAAADGGPAQFDLALVRPAQDRGAVVQQETMVRSVQEQAGRVRLSTDAGTIWARSVVGDGSAGRIGRYVGVEMAQVDLGLELELELTGPHRHDWSRRIHLDWGPLPGSYGWVFPKNDWLTVGVIAARGAGTATRAYLTELVAGLGLDQLPVLRSSGHLTQCRRDGSPLRRGRVLVAGDAAGSLSRGHGRASPSRCAPASRRPYRRRDVPRARLRSVGRRRPLQRRDRPRTRRRDAHRPPTRDGDRVQTMTAPSAIARILRRVRRRGR